MLRNFYLTVVQAVLLFGSEMGVMSPFIGRTMGGFHHQIICRLIGSQPRRQAGGSWSYPPLTASMAEASLEEEDKYVARR